MMSFAFLLLNPPKTGPVHFHFRCSSITVILDFCFFFFFFFKENEGQIEIIFCGNQRNAKNAVDCE